MENIINQIIRERRSHYPQEYSGMRLPDAYIQQLLENAHWAPNHTLNMPWRFMIITGEALNPWIDKAIDIYKTTTPAEKYKEAKVTKMELYKSKISHAIAIVRQTDPDKKSKEWEDIAAIACGVQNMYLSMSQYPHMVGYWSTGLGTASPAMHDYLHLNEHQHLMGFFVTGHIDEKRTESKRKSVDEMML